MPICNDSFSQVALSDTLLSSFVFQKVKGAELAWIDARFLRKAREDARTKDEDDAEGDDEENVDPEVYGSRKSVCDTISLFRETQTVSWLRRE